MSNLDEILVLVFGAAFGSFGGVLYSRNLSSKPTLWGSSACEDCGQRLLWREKLPILSFLWLKGRCSNCNERIPRELFFAETITSLLFLSIYSIFGLSLISFQLFAIAIFTSPLILIDIKVLRLPNQLTYTLLTLVTLQFLVGVVFFGYSLNFKDLRFVLIVVAFYFSLNLFTGGNFGMGDVKLSIPLAITSVFIDPAILLSSNIIAFYLGGVVAIVQLVRGRRRTFIPFGPFMLIGFWICCLSSIKTSDYILSLWNLRI